MRWIWAIAVAVALYAPCSASAEPPAVAALRGRWTYDAARSRQVERDLRITKSLTGDLHADGGSDPAYDFDLEGGVHPLSNGRTMAWAPTGPNTWLATEKTGDAVVETIAVTLSGDRLRMALHGKLPDGSPYQRTVTYRRDGHGAGLPGLWRSTRVDTGATWDGFVISAEAGGVVTWNIPTDLQVIRGPFDGHDLQIAGPGGATGSTIAVRSVGRRRFAYVMKSGGQVSERGVIAVSPDGRFLTELSWAPDSPHRKSKLVYEKDRSHP